MATVNGTVFISERARDQIGSDWPKHAIEGYVQDACENLGLDVSGVSVSYDNSFNAYSECAESQGNSYPTDQYEHEMDAVQDHFDDWVSGHSDESEHFNLCILRTDDYDATNVAGYASVGGNAGVVRGAKQIDDNTPGDLPQYDSSNFWAHAAVHEVGHNLSLNHGDGKVYPKSISPRSYAKTPHHPGKKAGENNCGEITSDWGNDPLWYDYYYHTGDCSASKIENHVN